MQSQEQEKLDYRLGEELYQMIEVEVVPSLRKYSSEKDFTRQAISNKAGQIYSLASGGRIAKRQIRLLSEIRGIEEGIPDKAPTARIKGEALTENFSLNLDRGVYGQLKDCTKETHLDLSKATRYCVFGQLSSVAIGSDALQEWQKDVVIRKWRELKRSLASPVLSFYFILVERFVLTPDLTTYFIERDPRPFNHFAESYRDDFYQTRYYGDLKDELGSRPFNSVENVIMEYSDIDLDPGSDLGGFLEQYIAE